MNEKKEFDVRPRALGALTLLAVICGATARTAWADPLGPVAALRLGYAVPAGNLLNGSAQDPQGGQALSDATSGKWPVELSVGYLFPWRISLRLLFEYAPVNMGAQNCPSGASCSAHSLRFGGGAEYRFPDLGRFRPWVGAGVAFEKIDGHYQQGSFNLDGSDWGWEPLNLQAGLEYKLGNGLAFGPVVEGSLGKYTGFSNSANGDLSAQFPDSQKAVHYWFTFGLRLSFEP